MSRGLCFDIHDLTVEDYKDSVLFIEVIGRLQKGPNADACISSK